MGLVEARDVRPGQYEGQQNVYTSSARGEERETLVGMVACH